MPSRIQYEFAASIVHDHGVIAYPTEGVYGLGCAPDDSQAVGRLLAIKQRRWQQGLILIAATVDQLSPYLAALTPDQQNKLQSVEAVTWIVPASDNAPDWITGARPTIAVRLTTHEVARQLCLACNSALVSTSANQSGRPPSRSLLTVRHRVGNDVDYVLGGKVGSLGRPTPIRNLVTGEQLR